MGEIDSLTVNLPRPPVPAANNNNPQRRAA